MYKTAVTIQIDQGLHMRPAAELVNLTKRFSAVITMRRLDLENTVSVNTKSLFKVLSLGVTYGTPVEISAEGVDASQAIQEVEEFFLRYEE